MIRVFAVLLLDVLEIQITWCLIPDLCNEASKGFRLVHEWVWAS